MATHHGKEGVVTSAGTAIDGVTGSTLDTTHDTVEDTQLNSTTKSFLAGRGTFTGSIDMNYDETDTPQTTLLTGTTLAFVFLPEGNTTGDESFSGSGIVTGMSISVPLDGVVTRTVSFQGTGALTIGTVS
jgi:predicted secreted protein